MRNLILTLAWLFATACHSTDHASSDAASPIVDGGLPIGVTPFAGTDTSLLPDDLAPLLAMVHDATYIGIGESVHTSGGYYAMKRRLIEELIAHEGLRVLAMETPRTNAAHLETYLQTSAGSLVSALGGIFPVFVDDNTEQLFAWIAAWNQQHPGDVVHFFGFDEQQPADDYAELSQFLQAAAPADATNLVDGLSHCQNAEQVGSNGQLVPYAEADYNLCLPGLDAIDAYLAAQHAALVAATDDRRYALAEIAALSLRSWQPEAYYETLQPPQSYEARDVAMHAIFDRLRDLDYSGQRIMIWMHNYHLLEDHPDVAGDYLDGVQTFGTGLHAEVGDAYAPIALIGYNVGINWPGVGTGPLPLPGPGSLETELHSFAQPYLIVDPQQPFVGPTRIELDDTILVASQQYRALVYLDMSPGMNAVFW